VFKKILVIALLSSLPITLAVAQFTFRITNHDPEPAYFALFQGKKSDIQPMSGEVPANGHKDIVANLTAEDQPTIIVGYSKEFVAQQSELKETGPATTSMSWCRFQLTINTETGDLNSGQINAQAQTHLVNCVSSTSAEGIPSLIISRANANIRNYSFTVTNKTDQAFSFVPSSSYSNLNLNIFTDLIPGATNTRQAYFFTNKTQNFKIHYTSNFLKNGRDITQYCDFTVNLSNGVASTTSVGSNHNIICSGSVQGRAIHLKIDLEKYTVQSTNNTTAPLSITPHNVVNNQLTMHDNAEQLQYGIDANNYCNFTVKTGVNGPTVTASSSGSNMICNGTANEKTISLTINVQKYKIQISNKTKQSLIPPSQVSNNQLAMLSSVEQLQYGIDANNYCNFTVKTGVNGPTVTASSSGSNMICNDAISGGKINLIIDVQRYKISVVNDTSQPFFNTPANITAGVLPMLNPTEKLWYWILQGKTGEYCQFTVTSSPATSNPKIVAQSGFPACTSTVNSDNTIILTIALPKYTINIINNTPNPLTASTITSFKNAPTFPSSIISQGNKSVTIYFFHEFAGVIQGTIKVNYGYDKNNYCTLTIHSPSDVKATASNANMLCDMNVANGNLAIGIKKYTINITNNFPEPLGFNQVKFLGSLGATYTTPTLSKITTQQTSTINVDMFSSKGLVLTYGYNKNNHCTFSMQSTSDGVDVKATSNSDYLTCQQSVIGTTINLSVNAPQYVINTTNKTKQSLSSNQLTLNGNVATIQTLPALTASQSSNFTTTLLHNKNVVVKYGYDAEDYCLFTLKKDKTPVVTPSGNNMICNGHRDAKGFNLTIDMHSYKVIINNNTNKVLNPTILKGKNNFPILSVIESNATQTITATFLSNQSAKIKYVYAKQVHCTFEIQSTGSATLVNQTGKHVTCNIASSDNTITITINESIKYKINVVNNANSDLLDNTFLSSSNAEPIPLPTVNAHQTKTVLTTRIADDHSTTKFGFDANNYCYFILSPTQVIGKSSGVNMLCGGYISKHTINLTIGVNLYTFTIQNLFKKQSVRSIGMNTNMSDITFPIILAEGSYHFIQPLMPNHPITIGYGLNPGHYCVFTITLGNAGSISVSKQSHAQFPCDYNIDQLKVNMTVGTVETR